MSSSKRGSEFWLGLRMAWASSLQSAIVRGVNRLNIRGARFVEPDFQVRLIGFVFLLTGVTLLLAYLGIQIGFWQTYEILRSEGLDSGHPMVRFVQGQERILAAVFLLVLLVSLLLSFILGLVYSHRIAGPIYRMKKHLEDAADGRAPRALRFREKDYFQDLAEAYNRELYSRGRLKRPGSQAERDYRDSLR